MRALATVAAAAGALLLLASPARGQTDPRLADAVRMAQEGQSDSARVHVRQLLDATSPGDTLYPQILYTQAMVADNAGEMRRQLQRVAVEYSSSTWADDALLRLVQMDYATRNFDGAAHNLEKLRLDYPATPLLAQAAYWAGRTYFDMNNPTQACRWLADGMAQSRNDVELQNQLSYMFQRCDLRNDSTVASQASADSAKADSSKADSAKADSAKAHGRGGRAAFQVQVAAIATASGAEDAARKARALGYKTVTVKEKGLYKVRAGGFVTRAEAQAAAARIKAKLGGSPFVVAGS
jgi:outer membrane protein assembly factor BamD (BamD/ComL family)